MADGALDAWALGVVAFELLTRTQAFQMIVQDKDEVLISLTATMCTHVRVRVRVLHVCIALHACHALDIIIVTLPGAPPRGGLCRW
jgi:hypothetical protein